MHCSFSDTLCSHSIHFTLFICIIRILIDHYVLICVLCFFRFPLVSELAPLGTLVGTILAAAINQTIFYSIVAGNELGIV